MNLAFNILKMGFGLYILYNFRNSLGSNDNPNAIEFKSAFRKLLICHPVMTSVDQNVITNATGILTVSSRVKKKPLTSSNPGQALELEVELDYEDIMLGEINEMDRYDEHLCAYVALCVENQFHQNVKQHKYKCSKCTEVFQFDDQIHDELLEMKGENKQPSISTFKFVIFANAIMKIYSSERKQGNSLNAIQKTVQENININDVYINFHNAHVGEETTKVNHHKVEFVCEILKTYMTLKSKKIGAKITSAEQGELIRRRKKRAVIVAGQ